MITAYRISRKEFASTIWSGIGARDFGGRWNSKGVAVIYTAESRSLAALEQLVHLIKPRVLRGFVIASISFDQKQIEWILPASLPKNWRDPVAPPALRTYGSRWILRGMFPVLAVPSSVVRDEWNYLINPAHAAFGAMPKSSAKAFVYDGRLR